MRARYSNVERRVWLDEKIVDLMTKDDLLVWLYLLTAPESTPVPGLIVVSTEKIALRTKSRTAAVRKSLENLEKLDLIERDPRRCLIWIRRALGHNMPNSSANIEGWADAWSELPGCPLLRKAAAAMMVELSSANRSMAVAFAKLTGATLPGQAEAETAPPAPAPPAGPPAPPPPAPPAPPGPPPPAADIDPMTPPPTPEGGGAKKQEARSKSVSESARGRAHSHTPCGELLPADHELRQDWRTVVAFVVRRRGAALDAEATYAGFVAHCRETGKVSADWGTSWRAWVEQAATFALADGRLAEPEPVAPDPRPTDGISFAEFAAQNPEAAATLAGIGAASADNEDRQRAEFGSRLERAKALAASAAASFAAEEATA